MGDGKNERQAERVVELVERQRLYGGHVCVDRAVLRHTLFAGGLGKPITREVIERGHAVGVLPYDPTRDAVVLIEQFRAGAYFAGRDPWLFEIVAGLIEPGETPEDVARREAIEEAGCRIGRMVPIADVILSPGVLSETIKLYCGEADCAGIGGLHGLDHEGEDIRAEAMPLADALAKLDSGTVNNAPAIVALQWLALHRDALRRDWTTP